jgi:hypothetical protein
MGIWWGVVGEYVLLPTPHCVYGAKVGSFTETRSITGLKAIFIKWWWGGSGEPF